EPLLVLPCHASFGLELPSFLVGKGCDRAATKFSFLFVLPLWGGGWERDLVAVFDVILALPFAAVLTFAFLEG
ncbi:hypothetical protein PIB30_059770, partial [Stylosanthes scabra]|nr:hypothetical protein [Stylosanthes scabra]